VSQVEVFTFMTIRVIVELREVLSPLSVADVGWLLHHAKEGELAFILFVLEVTLPAHGLLLLLPHNLVLEFNITSRELGVSTVHEEAIRLVKEQELPFLQVLLVAVLEVVSDVVVGEADVASGVIKRLQNRAAQYRKEEFLTVAPLQEARLDEPLVVGQAVHHPAELLAKVLCLFFVIISILLHMLLLLLLLFLSHLLLVFEILLGLLLSLLYLIFLTADQLVLLLDGFFAFSLSLFEGLLRLQELDVS